MTAWDNYARQHQRARLDENTATDDKVRALLKEQREAKALDDRLEAIKAWGQDVYIDGTVVAFNRSVGSNTYTYAAVKAAGHWYVTGAGPNRQPWDELVLWLTKDGFPTSDWQVLRTPVIDETDAIEA
jgi:hypothetical protein